MANKSKARMVSNKLKNNCIKSQLLLIVDWWKQYTMLLIRYDSISRTKAIISFSFKYFGIGEHVMPVLRVTIMFSKEVTKKKHGGIPQQGSTSMANGILNLSL